MGVVGTLSAVGMAVGPPLAYADQYISIVRKRDSTGFSIDICGLLICANVTRVFYWLGERFQSALLIQSLLMIIAQFALLYVCLLFKPDPAATSENEAANNALGKRNQDRPGQLWQWPNFGSYVEFVAMLIVFHVVTFLILHRFETYVTILGFAALGAEATLPIPQLLVNLRRKSTAGFRTTVLLAWLFGDSFKTVYYFLTPNNSIAFKACAVFQLSVDFMILGQTYMYRANTKRDLVLQSQGPQREGGAGAPSSRSLRQQEPGSSVPLRHGEDDDDDNGIGQGSHALGSYSDEENDLGTRK